MLPLEPARATPAPLLPTLSQSLQPFGELLDNHQQEHRHRQIIQSDINHFVVTAVNQPYNARTLNSSSTSLSGRGIVDEGGISTTGTWSTSMIMSPGD